MNCIHPFHSSVWSLFRTSLVATTSATGLILVGRRAGRSARSPTRPRFNRPVAVRCFVGGKKGSDSDADSTVEPPSLMSGLAPLAGVPVVLRDSSSIFSSPPSPPSLAADPLPGKLPPTLAPAPSLESTLTAEVAVTLTLADAVGQAADGTSWASWGLRRRRLPSSCFLHSPTVKAAASFPSLRWTVYALTTNSNAVRKKNSSRSYDFSPCGNGGWYSQM
mmetsp:Transcript_2819/g.6530  ORF Transcript_2819/g.6530 Transcript_2819/m.6530 type:complete len:220 (-) Transcript_2819:111-770(-)